MNPQSVTSNNDSRNPRQRILCFRDHARERMRQHKLREKTVKYAVRWGVREECGGGRHCYRLDIRRAREMGVSPHPRGEIVVVVEKETGFWEEWVVTAYLIPPRIWLRQ